MRKFEIKPLKFSDWERLSEEYTCCYAGAFYGSWEIMESGLEVTLTYTRNSNLAIPRCVTFRGSYNDVDKAIEYANRLHHIMMRQYITEGK
jgi:hypothetical protein